MNFKTSTQSYLNFFYYLGLSPVRLNTRRQYCISHVIYTAIQAFICCCIGIISLFILNGDGVPAFHTNTETILLSLFLLCDLVRTIAIFVQSLLYKDLMVKILGGFQSLELYFTKYLHHSINYKIFVKDYRHKVVIVFFVCFVYVFSFFVRLLVGDPVSYAPIIFKILQVMTIHSYLHTIFFIDLLSFHLKQLNTVVRLDEMKCCSHTNLDPLHRKDIRYRLKIYKIVHFRLWLANQQINKFFGYSIIGLLLHAFYDLFYSPFWIFQLIYDRVGFLSIWSKLLGCI